MRRCLKGKLLVSLAFIVLLKSSDVGIMSGGRPTTIIKVVTKIIVDTTVGLANVQATTTGSVPMKKTLPCLVRTQWQIAIESTMEAARQGTQRKLGTVIALQGCGAMKTVVLILVASTSARIRQAVKHMRDLGDIWVGQTLRAPRHCSFSPAMRS